MKTRATSIESTIVINGQTETIQRHLKTKKGGKDKNITFKFQEVLSFRKNNCGGEKAICIGYNPVSDNEEIDNTNIHLIKVIWNKYDGYILYNLYPQVAKHKKVDLALKENYSSWKKIARVLKWSKKTIILFWGRDAIIDTRLFRVLKKLIRKKKPIEMTVIDNPKDPNNGKFQHPSINYKLKTKTVKEANLNSIEKCSLQ